MLSGRMLEYQKLYRCFSRLFLIGPILLSSYSLQYIKGKVKEMVNV